MVLVLSNTGIARWWGTILGGSCKVCLAKSIHGIFRKGAVGYGTGDITRQQAFKRASMISCRQELGIGVFLSRAQCYFCRPDDSRIDPLLTYCWLLGPRFSVEHCFSGQFVQLIAKSAPSPRLTFKG